MALGGTVEASSTSSVDTTTSASSVRSGRVRGYGGSGRLVENPMQNRRGAERRRDYRGKEKTLTREVKQTPEMKAAAKNAAKELEGNLNVLIEMQRQMPEAQFNQILRDSGHERYLRLMKDLTWTKPGAEGRGREINQKKLEKFLSSPRGVYYLYDMLKSELGELSFSEGVRIRMTPDTPNQRTRNMKDQRVQLHKAAPIRSGINRLAHYLNTDIGGSNERGKTRFTRGQALAATLATGVVPGAAVYIYKKLMNPGVTMNIEQSSQALRIATQANAAQQRFSELFYGVSANDLRANFSGNLQGANTEVRVRWRGPLRTHVDKETREDRMNALATVVLDLQDAMHIDQKYQDPTGIDWLMQGNRNSPTGRTNVEVRTMEAFLTPGPNSWLGPDRARQRNTTNENRRIENIRRFYEIKNRIMAEEENAIFQSIRDGENEYLDQTLDEIEQLRKGVQSPEIRRRRQERLEKAKKTTAEDQQRAEEKVDGFQTFLDKVKESRETIGQKQQEQLDVAGDVTLIGIGLGGVRTTVANPSINDVRNALIESLTPMPGPPRPPLRRNVVIQGQEIESIADDDDALEGQVDGIINVRVDPVQIAYNGAVAAAAGAPPGSALHRTVAELAVALGQARLAADQQIRQSGWYTSELQGLDARRQLITDALNGINAPQRDIDTAIRNLRNNSRLEGRRIARENVNEMPTALRTITGFNALVPGVDLGLQAMATENVGVLQQRLNDAHAEGLRMVPPNTNIGWPPSENGAPERREMLLGAMAEARASRVINSPTAEFAEIIDPVLWNVPEADLRLPPPPGLGTLDSAIIRGYMLGRMAAIGRATVPSIAEIDAARDAARYRFMLTDRGPNYWRLHEVDFISMSAQEIRDHMIQTRPGLPTYPTAAYLENVKQEARRRFSARQRAWDEVKSMTKTTAGRAERAVTDFEAKGVPTDELDAVKQALLNYIPLVDDLGNREMEGTRNSMAAYLSTRRANPDLNPRFMEAERGEVEGYLEMLNSLFDYRNVDSSFEIDGQHGPEAAYRFYRSLVPPEFLANALRNRWNLQVYDPPPGGGWRRSAPNNIGEAVWSIRYNMGLPVTDAYGDPMRGPISITQQQFSLFLGENVIFDYLGQQRQAMANRAMMALAV